MPESTPQTDPVGLARRFTHLALINAGEAITTLGNALQQSDGGPLHRASARIALARAMAALDSKAYEPPPDVKG